MYKKPNIIKISNIIPEIYCFSPELVYDKYQLLAVQEG